MPYSFSVIKSPPDGIVRRLNNGVPAVVKEAPFDKTPHMFHSIRKLGQKGQAFGDAVSDLINRFLHSEPLYTISKFAIQVK